MQLGRTKIGELVAAVGVVLGLIALWVSYIDKNDFGGMTAKYADDGTIEAVGIIILGLAGVCLIASLLGAANLDLVAAVAGAAAFGFLLFMPAVFGFKELDKLGWGAWLGICAGLVPIGAGAAHLWHKRSDAKAPGINLGTAVAAIGLVLIAVGVFMDRVDKPASVTYWKSSASGHALGLLMLLLVVVSVLAILAAVNARKGELADLALIISGVTAGLAVAQGVHDAFGSFDLMGSGGWIELIGGLALLLGLIGSKVMKLPALKS